MLKNIKIKTAALLTGLTLAVTALPASSSTVSAEPTEDGTVAMLRLYNPNSGEHFYTSSEGEKANLVNAGWDYEGIGWFAPAASNTPVYRLYNPNSGEHHYTVDSVERDYLVSIGWNDEGIGWYSDDNETVALFRQFNPNVKIGTHNYTTSKSENDSLKAAGWKEEGISWYAVKEGIPYVKPASSGKINVDEFMAAVDNVYKTAEAEGWHYGGSRTKVPCADKVISCDRLIARAIYDMGYTDQPAGGYGLSGHGLENYLAKIGFTASKNDWSAIRRGSVMFVNKDGDPTDYEHAFVVDSYDPQTTALTRYDAGVVGRVSPVIHATNNPFPSWWDHNNFLVMNP